MLRSKPRGCGPDGDNGVYYLIRSWGSEKGVPLLTWSSRRASFRSLTKLWIALTTLSGWIIVSSTY